MQLMNVRVEPELKDAFLQTCKNQDTTAAREVRQFMRKFVAKNAQESMRLTG